MCIKRISLWAATFLIISLVAINNSQAYAQPTFANASFQQLWQYSDKAVAEAAGVGRGYTWGPAVVATLQENYVEGTGGSRQVEYFDKSRMELSADGKSVTNGLLTKELVSGFRQDGDYKFTQLAPSQTQVIGDDNSQGKNNIAPTYVSFSNVVSLIPGQNRADDNTGGSVRLTIDHDGNVGRLPIGTGTATIQTIITAYEPVFGHNIPKVFADYLNLRGQVWNGTSYVLGPVYTSNPTANVFGYAITEPYWTQAVVAGKSQAVLVQLFERRVLTYTPSNPVGFQVEMGNVGQHYLKWRYGNNLPNPTSSPNPNPTPQPTPVPIKTPPTKPVPIIYTALGASDVVGVGADNPNTDSWVVKISQQLPAGSTFVRLGISGAKLADVISQLLPQAITAKPTLVTDWNVVNDINAYLGGALTAGTYQSQLDNFLSQLVSQTAAPIFVGNVPDLTALPAYAKMGVGVSILQPVEQQFNAIITSEAAKFPNRVYVVDLSVWNIKVHPEWISGDGFHPSTVGYAQLAQVFLQQIMAQKVF